MKRTFRSYLAIWFLALAIFNLTAFLIPHTYDSNFFVGYIFITLAFLGQLLCAHITFKAENLQHLFYKIPLTSVSISGTIVMLVSGTLTMAVPGFPDWLGIILCFAVLGFTAMGVIGAGEADKAVEQIDQKIKADTFFIQMLSADAEGLMTQASPDLQPAAKKVWEALRYSDPMSKPALTAAEAQINLKFAEFRTAVLAENEKAMALSQELLFLIEDRNRKCKILK